MIDQNQIKQDEKDGINAATAAMIGAVIGVGIAVVGAVALKDKKNREKIKRVLTNARDEVADYMEGMQKQVEDKKSEVEEKVKGWKILQETL